MVGEPNTKLIVCSRSEERAEKLVSELRGSNTSHAITFAALDHTSPTLVAQLRPLAPDVVIHTAGPFQGQDYRVARACLECGSHYIDLADGREFVAGFGRLDEAARDKDLLFVSGASTLPGVSSAVIDHLSQEFSSIQGIEMSIAPGHRTPRGSGTISAVLSYCGAPFQVWENGRWVTRYGWHDLRLQRHPALGRRLSGACDVPDLELMPKRANGCETVTFHAALEAWWEHIALWTMGWLTRARVVKDWSKFTPAFKWLSEKLARLGSDIGGMQVRVKGLGVQGERRQRTWYLTARSNHGPEIPCAPALVLARKLLRGQISARGALPCLGLMTLSELSSEMSDFDVSWEILE